MIFFDEHTKTFYLESKNVSYIFCVNECGFLNHLYYGKRISREDLSHTVYLVDRGHGSNIAGKWRDKSLNVYANEEAIIAKACLLLILTACAWAISCIRGIRFTIKNPRSKGCLPCAAIRRLKLF